jgi:hypothetical protein
LIGVQEQRGARNNAVKGDANHLLDGNLQQFVNEKTNRFVRSSYDEVPVEDISTGVITVPLEERSPCLPKDFDDVKQYTVCVR